MGKMAFDETRLLFLLEMKISNGLLSVFLCFCEKIRKKLKWIFDYWNLFYTFVV